MSKRYEGCKSASHTLARNQNGQSQAGKMGSGSQSEHRIHFILPTGAASYIIRIIPYWASSLVWKALTRFGTRNFCYENGSKPFFWHHHMTSAHHMTSVAQECSVFCYVWGGIFSRVTRSDEQIKTNKDEFWSLKFWSLHIEKKIDQCTKKIVSNYLL